jgi:hypothetical protein
VYAGSRALTSSSGISTRTVPSFSLAQKDSVEVLSSRNATSDTSTTVPSCASGTLHEVTANSANASLPSPHHVVARF